MIRTNNSGLKLPRGTQDAHKESQNNTTHSLDLSKSVIVVHEEREVLVGDGHFSVAAQLAMLLDGVMPP